MSAKRHTADSITDDALDELYENANRGWRRGDAWKERALKAEAALERVTDWCEELDTRARRLIKDDSAEHPVAASIRHRIADPEETNTP
jgi:hypothetical protein